MRASPRIDDRPAQHIFDQVEEDLRRRLGVNARAEDPMAEALLRVFARYCEVIIQRLNRAPEKNYLAFLDTLNLSRIAPLPAQAPLTFSLVKKLPAAGAVVVVPAHTKVAAAPGPGDSAPVVFETTRRNCAGDITLEKIARWIRHEISGPNKTPLNQPGGWTSRIRFLAQTPMPPHEFISGTTKSLVVPVLAGWIFS